MNSTDTMLFYVTTPDKKIAVDLASKLVKKNLAACANIIESITSIYRWKGKIHNEMECMIIIKTTKMKSN